MPNEFDYPEQFQRRLLAAYVRKPEKMRSVIEPEYFSNPVFQDIARLTKNMTSAVDTKAAVLSQETLIAVVGAYLGKRKKDLGRMYFRTIKKLYRITLTDFPVLYKEAFNFSKHSKFGIALQAAGKDLDNRKYDSAIKRVSDLKRIDGSSDLGVRFWEGIRNPQRWQDDRAGIISTFYFPLLDQAMGGGVGAGELALIEGSGKAGKSTLLGRIAAGAMWQGKKVALASGELSALKYRKRIDSMLSGIGYYDLFGKRQHSAGTIAQLETLRKMCPGDIYIKAFPSNRTKISQVEAWLDRIEEEDNFKADILVLDYLSIFKPNEGYGDRRLDIGATAVDLRGLAMEKNIPCWSAAQVNRAGLHKPMIGPTDLAEDISLFFTTDFLVALCQTPDERGTQTERNNGKPERGRMILAASRDTASGAIINISIDRRVFAIKELGYWDGKEETENGIGKKSVLPRT